MRQADWQTEDGAIRLFLGDCLDVLPTLEAGSVDCVIVDPPYGIALANHAPGKERRNMDWTIAGDESTKVGEAVVAWAESHRKPCLAFASPMKPWPGKWRQYLVWEKGEHVSGGGDPWVCWKPSWELLQVARNQPLNGGRDGAVLKFQADKDDYQHHPSPKPIALMVYLVEKAAHVGQLVIDPCMGRGTTIAACVRTGRRAIGIESDPAHYAKAVKRISDELNRAPLFEPAPAIQRSLLDPQPETLAAKAERSV